MPSLRAVNEDRLRKERQLRVDLARRRAADLGVMTARSYISAKQEQDQRVAQDLAFRHQIEKERRIAEMDRVLYETQTREGLGFLSAQEYAARSAGRAAEELDAWEAEKALERERFDLALRREQLLRSRGDLARQEFVQRRQAVKEIENNRSRIGQGRSRSHCSTSNVSEGKDKSSYSVLVVSSAAKEPAHVIAARHQAEREEEVRQERKRVAEQRRNTAERASSFAAQQKEDEQRRQLEEEQDALLRLTMIENAMRSTVRPISSSDFQEQESRKAQATSSKAAQEFERTFLHSSSWALNDIRRGHHAPPSESSSTLLTLLADATVASLLSGTSAVKLRPFLFEAAPVVDQLGDATEDISAPQHSTNIGEASPAAGLETQCENEQKEGPSSGDFLNTSVEGPRPDHVQPQPIPRISPPQLDPPVPENTTENEKNQEDTQHEIEVGKSQKFVEVDKSMPAGLEAISAAALTATTAPLRDRHEQFLKDLQKLQQRLARASLDEDDVAPPRTASSAVPHQSALNDSSSTTMTSEASDVSLSSMSADAEGGAPRAHRKASSGMTAEQLRNALRKMKFAR